MKKNFLATLITVLLFISGCGDTKSDSNTTIVSNTEATTVETTTITEITTESTTPTDAIVSNDKPMEIVDVSDTEKTITFYRDGMKIFGKLHLPEGDGPFPVAILSGGFGASYTTCEGIAQKLAENGIAGVTFDFTGAVSPSKSDGSPTEYSVLTEAADLNTVFKEIATLDRIDNSNIFLWGHSFGGLVSTYVAIQEPTSIKGLVLVEPSYQARETFSELFPKESDIPDIITNPLYAGKIFVEDLLSFDIYEIMPNYTRNVLILQGTVSPSMGADGPEYVERALEKFPAAKNKAIDGANHSFGGESRNIMIEETITFINDNLD